MEKTLLNIVGGFDLQREPKIDSSRTINMYVIETPQGKTSSVLAPMAGLKTKLDIASTGEIRALLTFKDKMYIVASNTVYQTDNSFILNPLGTIGTSSGYVGICNNVNQVFIVDGSKGYIWDTNTSTFSEITATGFPPNPTNCAEIDGYFIANEGGTRWFQISALNDGLSWDALDREPIMSQSGDVLRSMEVLHRHIFFMGDFSTEVWYDAGGTGFPFKRSNNLLLEYGCAAPSSVAKGEQLLFWLAGDKNGVSGVVMTEGDTPKVISTPAIEYSIQSLSSVSDGRGTIYSIGGHVFYELSFTTANRTYVYDATTKLWFEKQDLDSNRSEVNCHTFFNNKHYVGKYNSQRIYELSSDYYTVDDDPIKRLRICSHVCDNTMRKVKVSRINLDFLAGEGIPNTEYEDTKIWLSCSRDGGYVYGNAKQKSLGKLGERRHRCLWRRLGMAYDWVFKFEVISKNKIIILGAAMDYEIRGR